MEKTNSRRNGPKRGFCNTRADRKQGQDEISRVKNSSDVYERKKRKKLELDMKILIGGDFHARTGQGGGWMQEWNCIGYTKDKKRDKEGE